jgi:hypothetical protein
MVRITAEQSSFLAPILVFTIATALLVRQAWQRESVGLGLAYAVQLWINYGLAGALHALPWAELPETPATLEGFGIASYGIAAFAVGWALEPNLFSVRPVLPRPQNRKLVWAYVLTGLLCFFVLSKLIGGLPSLSALTAVGQQLWVVGVCLGCRIAWGIEGWRGLVRWIAPSLLFPVITITQQGFLGYGVAALAIIATFCATFVRPRWLVVFIFVVSMYCGLSFYVAYMRDRIEIREAVWGGGGFSTRLQTVVHTIASVEPLDLHNEKHLELIDARLNQNFLLGLAARHLAKNKDYAEGQTLYEAALGLIPRVLWPEKPVGAGSGDWVSRYTELEFAAGTSVGIGTVLEFYLNFGIVGVLLGFLVLGIVLRNVDRRAYFSLQAENWQQVAQLLLLGVCFLQVGGSLVEVTSSAAASVVVAKLMNSATGAYAHRFEVAAPSPQLRQL